jgi:dCTP diphosphatase
MKAEVLDLTELQAQLAQFAADRDWEIYHNPKNLSMALAGEAGELLELFQWKNIEESQQLSTTEKENVADELADILLYTVRLADRLQISLPAAAANKLKKNAAKYPVEKSRGNALKYNRWQKS